MSCRLLQRSTGFAAADFLRIRNADLGRFTLDRLMRMIAALNDGLCVTVHVSQRGMERAAMVG